MALPTVDTRSMNESTEVKNAEIPVDGTAAQGKGAAAARLSGDWDWIEIRSDRQMSRFRLGEPWFGRMFLLL